MPGTYMHKIEYLVLDTKLEGGAWRPWYLDGVEIPGWTALRFVPYLKSLGERGWDLSVFRALPETETFVFKRTP